MTQPEKIIRLPEVEALVGLKKSAIYKMINADEFPKPFSISKGAKGWLESSVQGWIRKRAGIPANDGQMEAA
jgi:prophage regulatory protein